MGTHEKATPLGDSANAIPQGAYFSCSFALVCVWLGRMYWMHALLACNDQPRWRALHWSSGIELLSSMMKENKQQEPRFGVLQHRLVPTCPVDALQ